MDLVSIRARLTRPLVADLRTIDAVLSAIGPRMGLGPARLASDPMRVIGGRNLAMEEDEAAERRRISAFPPLDMESPRPGEWRPYDVYGPLALICVHGVLVSRGAWIGADCGMTSYEGLRIQIDTALADPDILGIVFDVNSGGGEAAGCFDLADRIYAARQIKPSLAIVGDWACSAAYALASAATGMAAPRVCDVGSIGVWSLHWDMSKQLEAEGLTPTLVFAGDHKIDGHPFAALPDAVRDRMQRDADDIRTLFAECVARNRGLSVDAVLATEADVYAGAQALELDLIDEVADRHAAVAEFLEVIG